MLKKPTVILTLLSIVFLGVYFLLATPIKTDLGISDKFDWPDETANYFWIQHYAQTGQLKLAEPLNAVAQNQIHPRSFNVLDDGSLVPGSFVGLIILYGNLVNIFGRSLLFYFTPLLAILAVWAFFGIIRRVFDDRVAELAAVLMFFHPAWWYYSVTPMLPNVAFLACLLFSIFFLLSGSLNRIQISGNGTWGRQTGFGSLETAIKIVPLLLAALFGGLAVSIRPSEAIWVAVLYSVVLLYRKIRFLKLVLFLAVIVLVLAPSFYQHQILYGSWFSTGYDQLQQTDGVACQTCQTVKSLILPFGFHPFLIGYNFWIHFISRFWWLSLLAILGLVVYLSQKKGAKNEIFVYILLGLLISGFLAVYYGSWEFSDKLTLNLNTLGISYIRYWLPIYLFSLPFIAAGIIWLTRLFPRRFSGAVMILILTFVFYQSANLVLRAKPDSILPVRNRIVEYKKIASQVFAATEPDSIIVTVRKDKLFFPERKVIHTFDALSLNDELLGIIPFLVNLKPVYYYALGQEPTLELKDGLTLEPVLNIGREVLYKVK